MFSKPKVAPLAAEFLGTGTLVMVALSLANTTAVSYFIATSVAVTLGLAVMLFGSASRAHFNPAVTLGFWSARKMPTLDAASHIVAQLAAGLASLQLYEYLVNRAVTSTSEKFNTRMWLAEVIGAAILAIAVAAAVNRRFDALQTALTVGGAFFVGIMVASVASAGLINPAIAIGLREWNAIHVLGPLVGGLVGVNLYAMLFENKK